MCPRFQPPNATLFLHTGNTPREENWLNSQEQREDEKKGVSDLKGEHCFGVS